MEVQKVVLVGWGVGGGGARAKCLLAECERFSAEKAANGQQLEFPEEDERTESYRNHSKPMTAFRRCTKKYQR